MSLITLVTVPYITLKHDPATGILYVDWTGDQTKESVMDGCEKILYFLKQLKCTKALNDNSNVTSIWLDATWWVAVDWFPRMYQAGCRLVAWVESPDPLCKLSMEETLKFDIKGINVQIFENKKLADEWLKGYHTSLNLT